MQLAWLTAAALGLCLGFVLDGCVSLRNQACALARQRLASPGYWAVWLGALLVMLGLANAALWSLKTLHGPGADLFAQGVFLVCAIISAVFLIRRRLRRCTACDDDATRAHP